MTHDGAKPADNVSWYFSAPLDPPASNPEVKLDRRTHYKAGRVSADIGVRAIGNSNETMHSAGMDRQFRGEIRVLQIFGSRLGGRGALALGSIITQMP